MTVDIGYYQAQAYPAPPCWALVTDVYARELALPVHEFKTIDASVRSIASAFRLALHKRAHGFAQAAEPAQWAVVLMGRSARLGLHHCGVVIDGAVLHALPSGVVHQDLASLRDAYPLMEFWRRPDMSGVPA